MFDTLFIGGSVIDGTGAPAFEADVGIVGDRIAAIGMLGGAAAGERIDARGLTVAPGFVDIHTHSDFTLLVDGRADSQVCQGVTTEVIGQCGFSCAPLASSADAGAVLGYVEDAVDIRWRSFGEYLDRLQQAAPAVNVAAFVGHGALHRAAVAQAAVPGTGDQVQAMVRLAEDAFDAGAIGLSTGLEYWPGNTASPEEIAAMSAVAARRGGLYATHVRNRDIHYDLGFTEAVATARQTGARLQISHIQPKFGAPAHAMQHTLELIYRARREGVDVAFDIIPHDWSHTCMVSILPPWAREGGTARTLERLKDPALRRQMKDNPRPIWRLVSAGRWDDIVLLSSAANQDLVGMNFTRIGAQRGTDPYDAVLDLLLEEGEGLPNVMWTSRSFNDADVCMCLREAGCSVMSDTLALSRRGPLKDTIGSLSGYGWTARLLGHYVRDRQVITLPEAIRRLTSQPAQRLGLADRGRLRPGAFADLVVLDPPGVEDRSSVLEPLRHPAGFHHVMVNGRAVVRDGVRNDERPGRVLRR
ncbi:N-acyl-D-amino-acid deacylase family protein [Ramlibacter tataouinensis]|uniref:N-acyl-D-glutamate deacylase (N-acyl-D-glutamate amidohydrolase) and to D-aminoacylase (N-acyl-D-amino-acid deacylase)-like protein n=1 Tax=Ramlibacter tataouinensis (strain ATCC BAA-407 / DSM 14655 / LMG 21543 / TTB310) TaxID=365046 RepID=F5Y4H8_RAMTT|nr:D-aminoacylase [Ramlibacter tataouinensis]AEG93825.1 N-acyl-D-glutamate deacylase (N-acyl-D-glutamate amidohydrolase) and to D-aminoacylase (N-acyl-D-amino-acid deacylase)-like protein [Ramlibacter tataouinensis TTB310]